MDIQITGKIVDLTLRPRSSQGNTNPLEGSKSRVRENTNTSRMPNQNTGVARPMLETTVTTLSIQVPPLYRGEGAEQDTDHHGKERGDHP